MGQMKGISVDPASRTATVQPGVTTGEVSGRPCNQSELAVSPLLMYDCSPAHTVPSLLTLPRLSHAARCEPPPFRTASISLEGTSPQWESVDSSSVSGREGAPVGISGFILGEWGGGSSRGGIHKGIGEIKGQRGLSGETHES